MKVKTTIALIIDNQRIEAGSIIDIDEATYPSVAAYVTVLESDAPVAEVRAVEAEPVEAEAEPVEVETEPVAEVTEDKPKRKRA